MKISDKKVVSIKYTLKNDGGEVLDTSEGQEPLAYIQGTGSLIPGLEKALNDQEAGAKINAVINPAEAYGVRNEEMIQAVPISNFEKADEVKAGIQFQVQTPEGVQIATVLKVENEEVTVDMNHPLAGETLHFDVEVMEVREPTEDELSHGHVHGPGGHHH